MDLSYRHYQLKFKHPFGVAGNVRTHTDVVYVKISDSGTDGYGEAALPPYLPENVKSVFAFLEAARAIIEGADAKQDLNAVLDAIDNVAENNNAAKASLDIALHDLYAKKSGVPLYKYLNLPEPKEIITAHTIAIGDSSLISQKIEEAKDFKILKVKLGTENDKSIIEEIRKHTDKPLYVDVNQGWKNADEVIEMSHWLKERGVVLIEQPLPVSAMDDMKRAKAESSLPLFADESVKRLEDIDSVVEGFHGINIKLMKSTGIREALRMIDYAKSKGLKIYLGCMGESSCATSAMAHLASLADFIDLDAPALIVNDPFHGLKYLDGKLDIPNRTGVGLTDLTF